MKAKKTTTAASLLRQLATLLKHQDSEHRRQHRALELIAAKLDRRLTKLERGQQRLEKKVNKHTAPTPPRQRQRHIQRNLTQTQKYALLLAWEKHHEDEVSLKREGRQLAKGFGLNYERQVLRWFKLFERMPRIKRQLVKRQLAKKLNRRTAS